MFYGLKKYGKGPLTSIKAVSERILMLSERIHPKRIGYYLFWDNRLIHQGSLRIVFKDPFLIAGLTFKHLIL